MRMNRVSVAIVMAALLCGFLSAVGTAYGEDKKGDEKKPAAKPAHRVVAIYFHRTKRCNTCKTISAYIEEAIKTGMAAEMKSGKVSVHMIDFQDPKNKKQTKAYKITRPTLVVADVHNGKVTEWKPMPKVWSLVFEKKKFFKYVQDAVTEYLKEK
jgi:hypothetical protein